MSEEVTNKEKLKMTLDYIQELNLNPPTEVINAINDIFEENDQITAVDFFFKDGIDDFREEMTLVNEVNVNLDGSCDGKANDVFTYYGSMKVSLSEFTKLYNGNALVKDDITQVDNRQNPTEILNPDDYIVVLVETTRFEKKIDEEGHYEVEDVLRVYCPIMSEEESDGQEL